MSVIDWLDGFVSIGAMDFSPVPDLYLKTPRTEEKDD